MNYASAGALVDPAVLVPLVDPATTGPLVDPVTAGHITISRCSHSLSHQWIQPQLFPQFMHMSLPLDFKSVNFFALGGGPFF